MEQLATEMFYGENVVAVRLPQHPDTLDHTLFVPTPALSCWIRKLVLYIYLSKLYPGSADNALLNPPLADWRRLFRQLGTLQDTAWQERFPRLQSSNIILDGIACLAVEEQHA
jgi:hypothetical protein